MSLFSPRTWGGRDGELGRLRQEVALWRLVNSRFLEDVRLCEVLGWLLLRVDGGLLEWLQRRVSALQ
jgi:hypothetical protein